MKKIVTLSLFLGLAAATFAQSRSESKRVILGAPKKGTTSGSKDVITGGGNNGGTTTYPTSGATREQEIDRVNREYDAKIISVRNNPLLSAAAKQQRVNDLNLERERRIREINAAYGYGNQGNGTTATKGRKGGKGNNGNHYGWEKGKGNPHKSGGKVKHGKGGGHDDDDNDDNDHGRGHDD
ncbi:MAG: hypothetical protein JWP27_2941 [Flaviaesturariibacter sp.]|nr:hypothetical protein [Flaviaesturariibacter sp.]